MMILIIIMVIIENNNLIDHEYKNSEYNNIIDKLNDKLCIIKSINIQKCINWCNKYNIEINKSFNS